MKILSLLLVLLPATVLACGPPPDAARNVSRPRLSDCGALLRQIDEIAPKVGWQTCVAQARHDAEPHPPAPLPSRAPGVPMPPPPPPIDEGLGPADPAYCRLVDPAAKVDACLAASITDASPRSEPFCPPMRGSIAIGDLAFLLLSERHHGLWDYAMGSNMEIEAYFRSMERPGRRAQVQRRALRWLHDHDIAQRASSN